MKALQKGLSQLCEEGATQLFKPLRNNDLILGAIGQLQFEVVAFRLQDEYSVQLRVRAHQCGHGALGEPGGRERLREFREKAHDNLAVDHAGELVYLAPTRVNLGLTEERWPEIKFLKTAKIWRRELSDQYENSPGRLKPTGQHHCAEVLGERVAATTSQSAGRRTEGTYCGIELADSDAPRSGCVAQVRVLPAERADGGSKVRAALRDSCRIIFSPFVRRARQSHCGQFGA